MMLAHQCFSEYPSNINTMPITIQHPGLGEVKGNAADGTAEFLGLQYATIRNRLATAEMISNKGTECIDATSYGYVSMAFVKDASIDHY
jgi:hypothetical protein